MKIHRFEGVNLNSLYGAFEVDLDATLGGCNLFLIHGPTGSGKSTLMDAVSLALFGLTPRLHALRGDETADPRAIMSRGSGECSATVVFSKLASGGRQTYRARWSCWRARRRVAGAWQRAERSLELQVPGEGWQVLVSSSKEKEFAPIFREVLEGFGVSDFNRSMLLAQGRFDAFLGAKPNERADILERLTDTSIYQELGLRAARIQRRHGSRLVALGALASAGGGLDPEALKQLEEEHEILSQDLHARQRAFEDAEERRRWFEEEVGLLELLRQAEVEQKDLAVRADEARDQLSRLRAHERCEEGGGFRP